MLGLVRVSITGSVNYLNKKFVVVLAFVAPSVDYNVLPGGVAVDSLPVTGRRYTKFDFCCFRAMTLLLLHLVVNWQVFTINVNSEHWQRQILHICTNLPCHLFLGHKIKQFCC